MVYFLPLCSRGVSKFWLWSQLLHLDRFYLSLIFYFYIQKTLRFQVHQSPGLWPRSWSVAQILGRTSAGRHSSTNTCQCAGVGAQTGSGWLSAPPSCLFMPAVRPSWAGPYFKHQHTEPRV